MVLLSICTQAIYCLSLGLLKTDLQINIWVRIVYWGDYPGSIVKEWGRGTEKEGIQVCVSEEVAAVAD